MKRARQNLSHYRLTTFDQGVLVPVACLEVLPGDSFRHSVSMLMRVTPLVTPVMHPVHVHIHSYFVPNRIVWSSWEDFITDGDGSGVVPTVDVGNNANCRILGQHFGVGRDAAGDLDVNALPFRAYNKIWNEYYRDQDVQAKATESVGDTDVASNYALKNVNWGKDYFTTARPYPQQGANTMEVSFSAGVVPVVFSEVGTTNQDVTLGRDAGGAGATIHVNEAGTTDDDIEANADLASATASFDINEWRRSMAFQKFREDRNKFGSRYRDMLAFLQVRSSDARLDRPEYLGGGRQTVSFSEVLATGTESGSTVLGEMAGHGIAALRTRPYRRFFEEHGYVLTLAFVRPRPVYIQQVSRTFYRSVWSDFWQKELEMMGDQEVLNKEVDAEHSTPAGVFGYVPRHDEYRREPSYVAGEFRTSTLNSWHMARDLSDPALNDTFLKCVPTDRVYASTSTDQILAMISHQIAARRLVARTSRN